MAFVSKIGNLLKQAGSKNVNMGLSPSCSSLYQAMRSMSSAKLFVGGLSYGTDEMNLRETFAQYGEVIDARVITDRDSGRSRGFGFISYTSTEAATSALQDMDGKELHGRRIRVNYATEKPRPGFGGGYGGGGYGGGGYGGGNYGGGEGGGSYGGGNYGGGEGGGSYGGGSYGGGSNNLGGYGGGGGNTNSGNYNAAAGDETFFGSSSGADSGITSAGQGGNIEAPLPYVGNDEEFRGNDGFGDSVESKYGDGDDEPDDYANTTRG